MLDPVRDEQQRQAYELQYGYDKQREFERFKKAVEMCIAAGFLNREKLDEAIAFVGKFHPNG
jgi:hypothetical protein